MTIVFSKVFVRRVLDCHVLLFGLLFLGIYSVIDDVVQIHLQLLQVCLGVSHQSTQIRIKAMTWREFG